MQCRAEGRDLLDAWLAFELARLRSFNPEPLMTKVVRPASLITSSTVPLASILP